MGHLSGGTIQKLILAREMAAHPGVMVLTSPSAGLDLASQNRLDSGIRALAEAGTAVLLLSTELDEAQRLANSVWVLYDGRIVGRYAAHEREAVTAAMTGLNREHIYE
jgi:ABC-type uncharacterized transport system ATPase subunit